MGKPGLKWGFSPTRRNRAGRRPEKGALRCGGQGSHLLLSVFSIPIISLKTDVIIPKSSLPSRQSGKINAN